MPNCVLVLGTPRSGTSCVAGIVHHLGISMGDNFLSPDEWNPAGYFQDKEFEIICAEELNGQFPKWETSILPSDNKGAQRIFNLTRARASRGSDWGVKSNRLIYFLQALIDGAAIRPIVILTSRPDNLSIQSFHSRTGRHDIVHATGVITRMNEAISKGLAECGIKPSLVMNYDDLISDPQLHVAQIASLLKREVTDTAVNWVDANLRRYTNG